MRRRTCEALLVPLARSSDARIEPVRSTPLLPVLGDPPATVAPLLAPLVVLPLEDDEEDEDTVVSEPAMQTPPAEEQPERLGHHLSPAWHRGVTTTTRYTGAADNPRLRAAGQCARAEHVVPRKNAVLCVLGARIPSSPSPVDGGVDQQEHLVRGAGA